MALSLGILDPLNRHIGLAWRGVAWPGLTLCLGIKFLYQVDQRLQTSIAKRVKDHASIAFCGAVEF